jgi:hypothetical protein
MQRCLFRGIYLSFVGPLSGRVAIVVVEEAAQARHFFDGAFASSLTIVYMNYVAIQSLMVSLSVVVLHVLPDRKAKMFLSKENNLVQTLIAL